MRLRLTRSALLALAGVALGLFGSKEARALTPVPMTERDVDVAIEQILKSTSPEKASELRTTLKFAASLHPLITTQPQCPLPITIVNGSSEPALNVLVTATESHSQTSDLDDRKTTLHIPFIPPRSVVRGSIVCKLPTTTYGRRYGSTSIYYGVDPVPEISKSQEARIKELLTEDEDSDVSGAEFHEAVPGATKRKRVEAALAMANGTPAFKGLAGALLKSVDGGRALGRHAAIFMPVLAPELFTAAGNDGARGFLDGVLGSASSPPAGYVAPALAKLCDARQTEAARTEVWLAALGPGGANEAARSAIVSKCQGTKEQTKARLKTATNAQLGNALLALSGEHFELALAIATDGQRQTARANFLRDTTDGAKFARVSKEVGLAGEVPDFFVTTIAEAKPGALDAEKALFLGETLDRLAAKAPADGKRVATDLYTRLLEGKVPSPKLRAAIDSRKALAGDAAAKTVKDKLAKDSVILSPDWLMAKIEKGELDLADFLRRSPTSMSVCDRTIQDMQGCLDGLKGLSGLTGDAFNGMFVDAALSLVQQNLVNPDAVAIALWLSANGVDVSRVVQSLCQRAMTSADATEAYGQEHRDTAFEEALSKAKSLNPSAACIAEARSYKGSRRAAALTGFGLKMLGVLVPFAGVGFFARQRYRAVKKQLAKDALEVKTATGLGVAARLDGASWQRAAGPALAAAEKWLAEDESAEVKRAAATLAAVLPEARDAILARARAAAAESLKTGEVSSFLVELDGLALYVVCFPGRADQPQTVRRHAAFVLGWRAHVERLRTSCAADGKPSRVLSLLFFLRPNATGATMLVGFDGESVSLVPEVLLASEKDGGHDGERSRSHEHRTELQLDAAPKELPPTTSTQASA